jgi:hypothetical protein
MEHYAGLDVQLESASVCVVDATGRIGCKASVAIGRKCAAICAGSSRHPPALARDPHHHPRRRALRPPSRGFEIAIGGLNLDGAAG